MVQGILFALLQRERTGEGQKVSVSLYNSMLAMQMQEAAMIMMARLGGELGRDAAVGRVRVRQTGALVLVGAFKANPLRDICAALELPDLSLDPRFADLRAAVRAQGRAARHVPRALRAATPREHWLARLEEQDLLSRAGARHARGAGRPADAAQRDDHGRRRRGGRPLRFIASPIEMSARAGRPAPRAAAARRAHRRGAGRSGGGACDRRGRP